jgi:DNA-binding NarL/FixJ family response regulator
MNKITVSIAEDNPFELKLILNKLSNYPELELVFVATNGEDFLEKYSKQTTDIILMDIEMPLLDGITTTQIIKNRHPDAKILIITTFDDDEKIFNAILVGASGYILKDENASIIEQSIKNIIDGGAAMSAGIALKALYHIKETYQSPAKMSPNLLTKRELEIIKAIKDGYAYKQIAHMFFISEGTVRKHIDNIYRKMQVNNKMSAVKMATENRWI